jgi:two-component sensor histidine kinase
MHLFVWGMLFMMPYLLSSGQNFSFPFMFEAMWIPLLLSATLFYLNYFVLVNKLLFAKKTPVFIAVNLLLVIICTAIRFILIHYIMEGPDLPAGFPAEEDRPPLKIFVYLDGLSFIIPVAFSVTLKTFERWLSTDREKKELENARLQSELEHLKYQLQPHFFFNSLNNIFALVDLSPDKAKMSILALSTLMRYLLYESNVPRISLKKEIDFINKFIELMQLRTSLNTSVKTSFDKVNPEMMIAPLLLVPLIENAFKHGISAAGPNLITFKLEIYRNRIVFETRNKNYPKTTADRSGSGIGLVNVRTRLGLIYPGEHVFATGIHEGDFVARLEITV